MFHRHVPQLMAAAAAGILALAGQPLAAQQIPNLEGKALTVLGPMDPSRLGQTLMHEHIFIEFQSPRPNPGRKPVVEHLTLASLAAARMGGFVRDNGFLGDFQESLDEIMEFKYRGGGTIVDVSNIGLGRDPRALERVSRASGLNVVMGAGWYQKAYHPLDMDQRTVEQLTDVIVHDVTIGVDGTNIRSGIIGEVGINGNPLTPNEIKSTRASARASRITGAPITFHVGGYREEKLKILDVVASEGVDLSHVVMGHSNSISDSFDLMKRVLDRGVFIEFDYLGAPGGPGGLLNSIPDAQVAHAIVALIKAGYADRIVLSHDICTKIQLKKYGGMGYAYINDYFLPGLRRLGISDADIHKMMVDNPRRALTFAAPKPQVKQLAFDSQPF